MTILQIVCTPLTLLLKIESSEYRVLFASGLLVSNSPEAVFMLAQRSLSVRSSSIGIAFISTAFTGTASSFLFESHSFV